MLTIIGGTYRHRHLSLPPAQVTRPTSQRARAAVFNILQNKIPGATVMDVFAGSGAMGLEALSRGATPHVTFLENHPLALTCLRQNIQNLDVEDKCLVIPLSISALFKTSTPQDIIFIDPPYEENLSLTALHILCEQGWISPHTLVVVESKGDFSPPPQWSLIDERRYGIARISFLQLNTTHKP